MKKFTKICLILAAVFAFLGLGMLGGAMALGATSQEIGRKLDESRVWGEIQAAFQDEWLDFWEDHTDYDFLEGSARADYGLWQADQGVETYDFEKIQDIDLDVKRCAVYLENSKDSDVHVAVDRKGTEQDVKVKQSGKKLKIRCESKERPEAEIYLYLPEEELDEVELDAGAGYLSIRDLRVKELAVSVDGGVVETTGIVEASDSSWEVGAGTLEVCMAGREADYDYQVSCGAGTVHLGQESYAGVGWEKKIENRDAEYETEIQCGVGTIDFRFENPEV